MTTEARPDLESRARARAHELLGLEWLCNENQRHPYDWQREQCDRLTAVLMGHAHTVDVLQDTIDGLNDAANAAVSEREALQRERDGIGERLLRWRGIEGEPCKACGGAGSRAYGSTATWHGGIGGQMVTGDICDKCWGSGDAAHPWTNLRKVEAIAKDRDTALADLVTARAKLDPAREAFTRLLAMAQKPMKSWDAGRCVEAERVEEIAAEALEALA